MIYSYNHGGHVLWCMAPDTSFVRNMTNDKLNSGKNRYDFQMFLQATCSGFPDVAEQVASKDQCTFLKFFR
jgi:hypothetical protein